MPKKLAVILPGIGYHKDKPLLYYAAKLAVNAGFEIRSIAYHDMPEKIRGDADMMRKAAALACEQTAEQLVTANLSKYDSILLIGKSIGTIAAARFAAAASVPCRQIWYTPLSDAFSFPPPPAGSCAAFLGEADPWSDIAQIRVTAAEQNVPLYLYPDCNHSLECENVLRNLEILREVMQITSEFIGGQTESVVRK